MVVLNICEKIEPICLSKKMGLYISNLGDCPYEGWDKLIVEEFTNAFEISKIITKGQEIDLERKAYWHFQKQFPSMTRDYSCFGQELIKKITSNLICIYLKYEYEDMPMGGWDENPFDGRLCEKDYTEMIVDFFNFLTEGSDSPICIYSSNYDEPTPFHKLFWINSNSKDSIAFLKFWAQKLDNFLEEKNDYLKLDYLIRSIHDEQGYDAYHLSKMYSLCQLFLENEHESELDQKLPQFIDERYEISERNKIAEILRQMRNKVAHGDFVAFEKKAEEYAQKFMDGKYCFDYSEYSRKKLGFTKCVLLVDRYS